ncbi:hypothetical protein T484DRAFT_1877683, partial [Baffinella frigidus]
AESVQVLATLLSELTHAAAARPDESPARPHKRAHVETSAPANRWSRGSASVPCRTISDAEQVADSLTGAAARVAHRSRLSNIATLATEAGSASQH